MSNCPDLDRLFQESTFFPGLNVRLAALRPLECVAEEQLNIARKLAIARVRSDHKRFADELDGEDATYELKELEQQVTHLLPKLTRGGLLLTVWSVFERSVKDIAYRAAAHVGSPLSRSHFRSGGLLVSLELALSKAVRAPAFPDHSQRLQLELLAAVRNTLVHHDGRLEEATKAIASLSRSELEVAGLQIERDYDFDYIVPSPVFVKNSVTTVYTYVHSLAGRVFEELSPPVAPDA